MKGVYVIAIAFLAFSIEIAAKEYQPEQSIRKEGFYQDGIPTRCPFPDKNLTEHLPHENDCTKFYKCSWGIRYLQDCPLMIKGNPILRLHYNRLLQVCDWPGQAGCAYCPGKDKNGNWPSSKIPHESDKCNKYYVCKNGEKHLESCPPNKCFSRTCQNCVANPEGGNCDEHNETCRNNGEKWPHECNCNLYYECIDGEKIRQTCEGGLHFNPKCQLCTTPKEAGCILI